MVDRPLDVAALLAVPQGFHTIRAAADRLLIEVGGPGCTADAVMLTLTCSRRAETWQPMDRTISVPRPPGGWGQPVQMVLPAFYRASQAFLGIALPAVQRDCLIGVARVEDARRLPVLFSAVLAPGWEDMSMRLSLFGRLVPPPPR